MIVKSFIVGTFFSILILNYTSIGPSADDILGSWIAVEGNVKVRIFKVGDEFKAKVIWFDDSNDLSRPMNLRTDNLNTKPQLRDRKVIGMEALHSLRYNAKSQRWEEGFIYDASSGRTWNASASLEANGLLKVKGFWRFEFIGKTMIFKRVLD